MDAYDRHHKDLEEKLDEKTALLIKFQRISMEVNAKSPHKNEELNKALAEWSGTLEDHLIGSGGVSGSGSEQSFIEVENNHIGGLSMGIELDGDQYGGVSGTSTPVPYSVPSRSGSATPTAIAATAAANSETTQLVSQAQYSDTIHYTLYIIQPSLFIYIYYISISNYI